MDYKAKNLDSDDAFHKMMITPGIDDAIEMDQALVYAKERHGYGEG